MNQFVSRLSLESKTQLAELMRRGASQLVRKKAHAIVLSSKRYTLDQMASIFEVEKETVSEWIEQWESKGLEGICQGLPSFDQPIREQSPSQGRFSTP